MKRFALLLIFLLAISSFAQTKTQNVILITLDGARNEEIFGGLDLEIFKSVNKDAEKSHHYQKFWADTPQARREKLMPFFWGTMMKQHGSIAGNRALKSEAKTTNKLLFSYPGYSEIVTGQAHDDIIKSNDHPQNPYPSFLDFLQTKLKLDFNQAAAFTSWDAFERIDTSKPGAFLINAGYKAHPATANKELAAISKQQSETLTPWPEVRHDYYTFKMALAHMRAYKPRVVHIGLGETDDWAHEKKYARVLDALHLTDGHLKELWDFVQTDARYKDKTTIIITVDHGRGSKPDTWMNHWAGIPEATYIWMAFVSPDVKMRGEWQDAETIYQNQIAATLSKFVGADYAEQNKDAGKPIEKLFSK